MTIDWPAGPLDRACLVLDFDGTLAPIVSDPATSAMPDSTRTVLASLVGRVGRLAIVSGRPAGFLAERVGVDGAELVGLYGLERVVDGSVEPDPRVAPYLDALAAAVSGVATSMAGARAARPPACSCPASRATTRPDQHSSARRAATPLEAPWSRVGQMVDPRRDYPPRVGFNTSREVLKPTLGSA